MTRNEYDIELCYDKETGEFDWDEYQYLCDIAEYWECEEQKGKLMYKITINFLNGHGYTFRCKHYSITRNGLGTPVGFSYEGGVGECPVYFKFDEVEAVLAEVEAEENL